MKILSKQNKAALVIAGTLGVAGCVIQVPHKSVRHAQNEVKTAAAILKHRQDAFTQDSVEFTTKERKTHEDTLKLSESAVKRDQAAYELMQKEYRLMLKECLHAKKVPLIKAICEEINDFRQNGLSKTIDEVNDVCDKLEE